VGSQRIKEEQGGARRSKEVQGGARRCKEEIKEVQGGEESGQRRIKLYTLILQSQI
jgi:hypothetical protein